MLGLAYLSVMGAMFTIFMAKSPLWLRLCGRSRWLGTLTQPRSHVSDSPRPIFYWLILLILNKTELHFDHQNP